MMVPFSAADSAIAGAMDRIMHRARSIASIFFMFVSSLFIYCQKLFLDSRLSYSLTKLLKLQYINTNKNRKFCIFSETKLHFLFFICSLR